MRECLVRVLLAQYSSGLSLSISEMGKLVSFIMRIRGLIMLSVE